MQRLFHPGNGLDEVLEDGFVPGFDINGGNHPRQDAQLFAVFVGQFAVFGFDQYAVVGLVGIQVQLAAAALVAQGVRADKGHNAIESAVDGVIVGGEFDHGRQSGMDEGDVLRADIGLHQQGVVNGDDFHDVLPGVNHAADGGDFDVVHDAAHWRADVGALDRVGVHGEVFPRLRQFGFGAHQFVVRLGFVLVAAFVDL